MRLEIVLWPEPVLLAGTEPVSGVDDDLRQIVGEMRRVMFELRGVGLAAPQVGIARRLMLVCPSGEPGEEEVVINPEILDAEGEEIGEEGCLSFPSIFGDVPRARRIRVRYRDLDWREREMMLDGFVARVFLHEQDHLDGKVFIDRMVPASRQKVEPQIEELRRRAARTA
ncbi:MAG: peptide deformylase [Planctomycetota bacterium]|jgi:peptide deformylase